MKNLTILLSCIMLSNICFSQDAQPQNETLDANSLVGEWILDLRPLPDSPAYLQTLVIQKGDNDDLTGQFYGSPIPMIYVNKNWEKLYFAFKSSDNSHEYFQTGYIIDDEIFGTTFCPGRNFIMPWNGKRNK